jgi:hypothetical protein
MDVRDKSEERLQTVRSCLVSLTRKNPCPPLTIVPTSFVVPTTTVLPTVYARLLCANGARRLFGGRSVHSRSGAAVDTV